MPSRSVQYREAWDLCDRCGFPHPRSMLTMQKGLKLCSDHGCLDNLDIEHRDRIIAEVLQTEEQKVKEVSEDIGEEVTF